MRSAFGKRIALLFALAAIPASAIAVTQSSPPPQNSQSTGQTNTPQTAPKKKPPKPIDPDEIAGVRGSGSPLTVRVLSKGRTVENAHVAVKNANGSLAGSCFTSATGECKVDVGPDDYEIDATGNGRAGSLKLHVTEKTDSVSITLRKARPATTTPKP